MLTAAQKFDRAKQRAGVLARSNGEQYAVVRGSRGPQVVPASKVTNESLLMAIVDPICTDVEGHAGWLNCATHNSEIRGMLEVIATAKRTVR